MNTGNINAMSISPDRVSGAERSSQPVELKTVDSGTVKKDTPVQGSQQEQIDSREAMEELKDALNDQMNELQTKIGFAISEEFDDQVVVEIRNKDTDELIKQIPPDDALKIRDKMAKLTGLLFDKSV